MRDSPKNGVSHGKRPKNRLRPTLILVLILVSINRVQGLGAYMDPPVAQSKYYAGQFQAVNAWACSL